MKKTIFVILSIIFSFLFISCSSLNLFNSISDQIYEAFSNSFLTQTTSIDFYLYEDITFTHSYEDYKSFGIRTTSTVLNNTEMGNLIRNRGDRFVSEKFEIEEISTSTQKYMNYSVISIEYEIISEDGLDKYFLLFEIYFQDINKDKITNKYKIKRIDLTEENQYDIDLLYNGGDGSLSNPYLIDSFEGLNYIRYFLNEDRDKIAEGLYFLQTEDLDLSKYNWSPIGSSSVPFNGNYNGNGFFINGLNIIRGDSNNVGFFGFIGNDGYISNMQINGIELEGNSRVGSIAGVNMGTITNSSSNGTIIGDLSVGGLVGRNIGEINKSFYSGIVNGKVIYISNNNRIVEGTNLGGLVGLNEGKIENSYAIGYIEGNTRIGGLVGYNNNSMISNTYAVCRISGENNIGGLIGIDINGIINRSYYNYELLDDYDILNPNKDKYNRIGHSRSTNEMKTKSNYSGWDFVNVWDITNSYPFLR